MMLYCGNCRKKTYVMDEGSDLEGKVVNCKFCNNQWIYESKSKYLENRLKELNLDLDKTEKQIISRKQEYELTISQLENNLKLKKEELEQQKELQEKISTFEDRLKETEKLNSEELELDNKISNIKKEIRNTSDNISTKNKDIEEQTNYLESKINSYNDNIEKNESNKLDKSKIENTKSEVVNIRKNINKSDNKNINQSKNSEKLKKFKFFSPGFIK